MNGFYDNDKIRISIHALHEESDALRLHRRLHRPISIHALHEESDLRSVLDKVSAISISIHALHEESDIGVIICQSPLSHISIHALHEESDQR